MEAAEGHTCMHRLHGEKWEGEACLHFLVLCQLLLNNNSNSLCIELWVKRQQQCAKQMNKREERMERGSKSCTAFLYALTSSSVLKLAASGGSHSDLQQEIRRLHHWNIRQPQGRRATLHYSKLKTKTSLKCTVTVLCTPTCCKPCCWHTSKTTHTPTPTPTTLNNSESL